MNKVNNAWLINSNIRFYRQHPSQLLLTLLGLALGVAIATSVILTTASARKAFALSTEALYGRATHQILGGSQGVDAEYYRRLRTELGLTNSAPVIEGLASLGRESFTLLGIAPLAEAQLRPRNAQSFAANSALQSFVGDRHAVALDSETAARLGISKGETFALLINGESHQVTLALTLPHSSGSASLILTYIENARLWLERGATLDRIDLHLDNKKLELLQAWLPDKLRLVPSASHAQQMQEMTKAFNTNLTAMSLLALLIGAFLIHNTMSFVVVSRRTHYALYRSLGVTRAEILRSVLVEACALALLGSVIGAMLGVALAGQLIAMVTQTINDLYFVLTVRELHFSGWQWLLCVLLGTAAGTLPAIAAAWDAARTPPGQLALVSTLEQSSRARRKGLALLAVGMLLLGLALLALPGASLLPGFAALFAVVLGYALLVPMASGVLLQALRYLLVRSRTWGPQALVGGWRFTHAIGAIQRNMSRYGVALAALCVAIAATVGVDIMVGSFRSSVQNWLEDTLRSDIYISAPSSLSARAEGDLDPSLSQWLLSHNKIKNINTSRRITVQSREGEVTLMAIDPGNDQLRGFKPIANSKNDNTALAQAQAVQISEPLARTHSLRAGEKIELFTDNNGWQEFVIANVFRDYGRSQGMVLFHRKLYQQHWTDNAYSSIGLQLVDNADSKNQVEIIRQHLQEQNYSYMLNDNRSIREESLAIFDRTFAITHVLRLLTVGVAFLGLFSALMSVLLEKTREFAVFRALGARRSEMSTLILQQAAIIGCIAALLALPLGVVLAALLIDVINVRSFGWTIDMQISLSPLLFALALGLGAALLASILPARRLQKIQINHAMRME